MILTTVVFIFILGLLVFVHEMGHFVAAKISGIKVEEFAFGFPPRIWSKKHGETNYSINAIPIGGYVKMLGESEESQSLRSFSRKKPLIRAVVSVSGVLMNVVLAWLILSIGFTIGMSPLVSSADSIPGKKLSTSVIVAGVGESTPASKAGIKPGDILIRGGMVGETKTEFLELSSVINFSQSHINSKIELVLKRDNQEQMVTATVSDNKEAPLGISIVENSVVRVPFYLSPVVAFREIIRIIGINLEFLKDFFTLLFSTGKVSKEVGGPVAIYVLTGVAAKAGVMVVAQFIAILSISLALINIMPFPALDGGRLLFIVLEKIFRRKLVKENIENVIHSVGFVLIILLAILITYKDIVNFVINK